MGEAADGSEPFDIQTKETLGNTYWKQSSFPYHVDTFPDSAGLVAARAKASSRLKSSRAFDPHFLRLDPTTSAIFGPLKRKWFLIKR